MGGKGGLLSDNINIIFKTGIYNLIKQRMRIMPRRTKAQRETDRATRRAKRNMRKGNRGEAVVTKKGVYTSPTTGRTTTNYHIGSSYKGRKKPTTQATMTTKKTTKAAPKTTTKKKASVKSLAPRNNSMRGNAGKSTSYTIKSGDSLSALAKRYGTTVAALMKANPSIKSKNKIYAGRKLTIPGGGSVAKTTTKTPTKTKTKTTVTPKKKKSTGTSALPDYLKKPATKTKKKKTKTKAQTKADELSADFKRAAQGYTTISGGPNYKKKSKYGGSTGPGGKASRPAYTKPGYRGGLGGGQVATEVTTTKKKKAPKKKGVWGKALDNFKAGSSATNMARAGQKVKNEW